MMAIMDLLHLRPLLLLSLLLAFWWPVGAFIYRLDELLPSRKVLAITERYMFASYRGPPLLEQGPATIDVSLAVSHSSNVNVSHLIALAVYRPTDVHQHDALNGMCGEFSLKGANPWASSMYSIVTIPSYVQTSDPHDPSHPEKVRYIYEAVVRLEYKVEVEGWHNVALQFCGPERVYDDDYREEKAQPEKVQAMVYGTITFRNPYGYLPGELYGFLPFEGARMVGFFLFGLYYCYFYLSYRKHNLHIHHAILLVYVISLAESVLWYAAYQDLNLSGVPYCCPFPPTVIAAFVLQVIRETVSRSLLLVVSLGYGIVRPKLLGSEWVITAVVTLLYFISALANQIAQIIVYNDVKANSVDAVAGYQLPVMIINAVFLVWIYCALEATIRILKEFKQEAKLELYNRLYYIIVTFTILFLVILVSEELDEYGFLEWPWQYGCFQQISGEILNFAVFACVAIICQPSRFSGSLAYSQQLPTEEPSDEEGLEEEMEMDHDCLDAEHNFDSLPPVIPASNYYRSDSSSHGSTRNNSSKNSSRSLNPLVNQLDNYKQRHNRSSMMQEDGADFDEDALEMTTI